MADFPTTIKDWADIDCPSDVEPKTRVNEIQSEVEALQAKVGVDSSAVTTSIDYLLKNASSSDPGHTHTLEDGATDVTASAAELNILNGVTADATELNILDGVTSTTAELNYVDVAAPGTAGANKALITDINKNINGFSFHTPAGFLINGQIVTSISSDDLVVAIKTLAGTDPSASDPVYIRIDNVIRSITSALSVTRADGTNWFNAGSSELANNEVDYFVYLAWDVADATIRLGYSRLPWALNFGHFSETPTNELYAAFNTDPDPTDSAEVIGRFNAVLDDSGNDWTIPATSIIINKPIYKTRRLVWTPTYTAGGSMTWTSVSGSISYVVDGTEVHLYIQTNGTTGGTASTTLSISLPWATNPAAGGQRSTTIVRDGSFTLGNTSISSSVLTGSRYDAANFGLGGNRGVVGNSIWTLTTSV